jgi:hypothetical protein
LPVRTLAVGSPRSKHTSPIATMCPLLSPDDNVSPTGRIFSLLEGKPFLPVPGSPGNTPPALSVPLRRWSGLYPSNPSRCEVSHLLGTVGGTLSAQHVVPRCRWSGHYPTSSSHPLKEGYAPCTSQRLLPRTNNTRVVQPSRKAVERSLGSDKLADVNHARHRLPANSPSTWTNERNELYP